MLKLFDLHVPIARFVELLADGLLCFVIAFVALTQVTGGPFADASAAMTVREALLVAASFAALMSLCYACVGIYRRAANAPAGLLSLLGRAMFALLMGTAITYVALGYAGENANAMRLAGYGIPLLAVGTIVVRSLMFYARRNAVGARRVLIVGSGDDARRVAEDLASSPERRHALLGFVATSGVAAPAAALPGRLFPATASLPDLVDRLHVDEIIVAVREQRGGSVPMDQLLACRIKGVPVLDLAAFSERSRGEVAIETLKGSWLVYGQGFVQGPVRAAMKRVFDVVASLVLLAISAPVMFIAAVAIKLDSRGPLIYRQERVGLGGRSFMCLKFRSMTADAEKDGVARWAAKNDSRVTRVGAFMRKTRIDELPQLFSVLKGEMSLVGPRPERPPFVQQLRGEIPFYDVRHSVKPGVTGWAQVRYAYGASVDDARRKHQFDLYYVKNNSLVLDLLVLIETVSVVLFREGSR